MAQRAGETGVRWRTTRYGSEPTGDGWWLACGYRSPGARRSTRQIAQLRQARCELRALTGVARETD